MTEQIDIARVNERVSVQGEQMKTMHAEYEGALDRLRADMAQMAADSAKRDVDAAKRDNRLMLVIVGTIVAVGSLATAVLGILVTSA